jgi:hypothetical protein
MHKEASILLDREWLEEEREVMKRLVDSLKYYKYMIPSALKKDILASIQMCIKLKDDLDSMIGSDKKVEEENEGKDVESFNRRHSI